MYTLSSSSKATPSVSISRYQPLSMAPLASCRLRTSCCVKTMSPLAPLVTKYSRPSWPSRTCGCFWMRPVLSTMPALHDAGQQVHHAGAADAHRPVAGDGLDVDRLALGRDAHALDGAGDGLHAVADLVALEGGAGGAARHGDAAVLDQGDLGVGADVDGHGRALLVREARGGDDGERVRADEAGDGRRKCTPPLGFMSMPSSLAR